MKWEKEKSGKWKAHQQGKVEQVKRKISTSSAYKWKSSLSCLFHSALLIIYVNLWLKMFSKHVRGKGSGKAENHKFNLEN